MMLLITTTTKYHCHNDNMKINISIMNSAIVTMMNFFVFIIIMLSIQLQLHKMDHFVNSFSPMSISTTTTRTTTTPTTKTTKLGYRYHFSPKSQQRREYHQQQPQCHQLLLFQQQQRPFARLSLSSSSSSSSYKTTTTASDKISDHNNNNMDRYDNNNNYDNIEIQQLLLKQNVLKTMRSQYHEAKQYVQSSNDDDILSSSNMNILFYLLFYTINKTPIPLGLKGIPFILRANEIQQEVFNMMPSVDSDNNGTDDSSSSLLESNKYYTMKDIQKAVQDDFLDAARGSTDNRKGWQITDVSQPRGESFEEARMTYNDILVALEKGTVIFNAAGAHIPKLAQPSLCCTDSTSLPCALNLYITSSQQRTSAPPHTDKQDVMVIQTSGRKNWKVFTVPDSSVKVDADIFARGKMDDNLPLYTLLQTNQVIIDTTLYPGDVLFCPAGFPHTTSTIINDDIEHKMIDGEDETSIHLTLGIDHHIWELDYLSARRLALRRACIHDTALGQTVDDDKRYVGKVNKLPVSIRNDILAELPLGLLRDDDDNDDMINYVTKELERISYAVDEDTASRVPSTIWKETIHRVRMQGIELLNIHRDMYIAAIEEGRTRDIEDAMVSHLSSSSSPSSYQKMSPERIQRLSLFRVKSYYDRIDQCKKNLKLWSYLGTINQKSQQQQHAGSNIESSSSSMAATIEESTSTAASVITTASEIQTTPVGATTNAITLPDDWASTMPVYVGDQVEADLGGCYFPATVTNIIANDSLLLYDVSFFDGDKETGLQRQQIKLNNIPKSTTTSTISNDDQPDISTMTPKELKRWKKEQEKVLKKKSNK